MSAIQSSDRPPAGYVDAHAVIPASRNDGWNNPLWARTSRSFGLTRDLGRTLARGGSDPTAAASHVQSLASSGVTLTTAPSEQPAFEAELVPIVPTTTTRPSRKCLLVVGVGGLVLGGVLGYLAGGSR